MNLTALDWLILAAVYVLIVGTVVATRHHMRSVADYLAAGRSAGGVGAPGRVGAL